MSNPALDRVPHRQVIALLVDAAADAGYTEVPDDWWPEGFNDDNQSACHCCEHRAATMDVTERATIALMMPNSTLTDDARSLIDELVAEVRRLRGVLIDGAVDAYKRENDLT